jgi:hypothetical protein
MEMRSLAQITFASDQLCGNPCVSRPDLTDRLTLPFVDLLTRPTFP